LETSNSKSPEVEILLVSSKIPKAGKELKQGNNKGKKI
jgi:hypothetical protein